MGAVPSGGGGDLTLRNPEADEDTLYPRYELTADILRNQGVPNDFSSDGPLRYGHRRTDERDVYFVSNKTPEPVQAECTFRVANGPPELWNPVTGEVRALPQYSRTANTTTIPMEFPAYGSFFVVFPHTESVTMTESRTETPNFPATSPVHRISGAWQVSFNPERGGPSRVTFDGLQEWTTRPEKGIKYYSGIATYRKEFELPEGVDLQQIGSDSPVYLDLGTVHDIARIRLNGTDLGVVWCAPWRVEVTDALEPGENHLEIDVANRWQNRLIGDQQPENKNVRTVQWPSGLLGGNEFKTGRYTFTTVDRFNADSPLLPSGLLGPVTLNTR